MPVPVIAGVALGLSALGTGISAYSAYQQGQSAKRAADSNAALLDENAANIERQSRDEASGFLEQGGDLLSQQRAGYAKAGLRVDQGVAKDVSAKTMENILKDYNRIIEQGRLQAGQERRKADISRQTGQDQATAGWLNMGATLLTGMGDLAFKGAGFNWRPR